MESGYRVRRLSTMCSCSLENIVARTSITVCGSGGGARKGGLLSMTDRVLAIRDFLIVQENRDLKGILLYVGKRFEAIAEGYVALEGDNFCISKRKKNSQNCLISVQQTFNAFFVTCTRHCTHNLLGKTTLFSLSVARERQRGWQGMVRRRRRGSEVAASWRW